MANCSSGSNDAQLNRFPDAAALLELYGRDNNGRLKRKITIAVRYNPASKTDCKVGEGFECPRCGATCSYDDKYCPECFVACSYQAITGVVITKERGETANMSLDNEDMNDLSGVNIDSETSSVEQMRLLNKKFPKIEPIARIDCLYRNVRTS